MLVGMAVTFAAVATLAAVGGGWAVEANQYGRFAAMALLAVFGLTLLFPVAVRPADAAAGRARRAAVANPRMQSAGTAVRRSCPRLLLGVATGLLWAPCAGPILGLILTGAALQGANVQTSLLLARLCRRRGDLAGARAADRRAGVRRDEALARASANGSGAASASRCWSPVVAIALGLDTGFLTRVSLASTASLEQGLLDSSIPIANPPKAPSVVDDAPQSSAAMKGGPAMMAANPAMMSANVRR